ncbi:hypothetical protein IX51_05320 [uncultured archaeon]|nr:hypothetical protein IX51_05320 [uncultured archaeon]
MVTSDSPERLKKTNVGTFGLFFQGLGQEAPIAIFIGSVTGAAAFALGATPLAFIIGMLASLLSGNSIYQFSKKVAHAGGYSAYVNKGLGKALAAFTGYLYVLYELVGPAFIVLIYLWTFSGSINAVFGTALPNSVGIIYVAVALVAAFVVVFRGLRLSVLALTILGIIQFAIVFVISSILLVKSPVITTQPFSPAVAFGGWHGLFLGFITGSYGAYAGYGSVVPLGEEVKSPHKSIGRAVVLIIVIMGITYIFSSFAMVSSWGISAMSGFSNSGFPGAILAGKYIGLSSEAVVILVYNAVIFTPLVTMLTACSRMMYSLSRQDLLPKRLSRVHRKFGTPSNAVLLSTLLITLIIIVDGAIFWSSFGFQLGVFFAWIILEIIWSLSTLVIHVLVNTSLSVEAARGFRAREIFTHFVFPTAASLIIVLAISFSFQGMSMPITLAPITLVVYMLTTLGVMWLQKAKVRVLKFEDAVDLTEAS